MGYAAGIVFRNEWGTEEVTLFPPKQCCSSFVGYFKRLCGPKKNLYGEDEEKEEIVKYLYVIPMRKSLFEVVSKWTKIFRRFILMFLIGMSLSVIAHLFDFTQVRIMGVLQRIAICYFFVSAMLVLVPWTFVHIVIVLFLQVIYIAFTFGLLVPFEGAGEGCGTRGVLSPPHCTAEGYIDRLILSRAHIYFHGSYDPEGFLSTLPAITNAYCGVLAFKLAQKAGKDAYKRLVFWCLMGAGLILSGLTIDYAFLPIGKKLWTTSFSFVTSGIAFVFLSAISFIVDIQQYNKYWTSLFLWIGSNPLVMYCVPSYIAIIMMKIPVPYNGKTSDLYHAEYSVLFGSWIQPAQLASLIHGICYELVFVPLAFLLYWKKIFIKL